MLPRNRPETCNRIRILKEVLAGKLYTLPLINVISDAQRKRRCYITENLYGVNKICYGKRLKHRLCSVIKTDHGCHKVSLDVRLNNG
jgi:hypothetical protein